jgi:hypothetical protein
MTGRGDRRSSSVRPHALTASQVITHGGAFIVQVPEQEQEVADVT